MVTRVRLRKYSDLPVCFASTHNLTPDEVGFSDGQSHCNFVRYLYLHTRALVGGTSRERTIADHLETYPQWIRTRFPGMLNQFITWCEDERDMDRDVLAAFRTRNDAMVEDMVKYVATADSDGLFLKPTASSGALFDRMNKESYTQFIAPVVSNPSQDSSSDP